MIPRSLLKSVSPKQELQQLLTRFHKDGLVTSNVTGQGTELLKRGRKNKLMERVGQMSNILAIRYRGFDPERILNFLIRYTFTFFWLCLDLLRKLLLPLVPLLRCRRF